MKTIIGDKVFITKFAYTEKQDNATKTKQYQTSCYIKVGKEDTKDTDKILEVTSSCDSRDNYNAMKGRTIAFKRALNKLFTTDLRKTYDLTNDSYKSFIQDFKNQCPRSAHFLKVVKR